MVLYIDVILLASYSVQLFAETKSMLSNSFDMKNLGEVDFVLGTEIVRDRSRGTIVPSKNYIDKILKRFNMPNYGSGDVPIAKRGKLSLAQCPMTDFEVEAMKNKPYASLVSSIMYAHVCNRPNLVFALCTWKVSIESWCSTLECRKKSVEMLEENSSICARVYHVKSYTNADLGGCVDDKMSTSGYVFIICG